MRRPFIISLCVLNACIATGLLWFVFKNQPKKPNIPQKSATERLSDTERWSRANVAGSSRQAFFELSQSEDMQALKERTPQEIEKLFSGTLPNLDRWPFYQAVIQMHGKNAADNEELSLLARVASDIEQPLTLRDTALRSYVENSLRLGTGMKADDSTLSLIDGLFVEKNSLQETALQAEHFLLKNDALPPERKSVLSERLQTILEGSQHAESVRIIALNILSEIEATDDVQLRKLYQDAGVQMQTMILRTLASMNASEPTKSWLEGITPTTPEQEQLRLRILGQ